MKKLLSALSVFGLTLGFTTGVAFSQISFETADADQSGSVTFEEASAAGLPWTLEQFSSIDLDRDGALNEDEFATATQ